MDIENLLLREKLIKNEIDKKEKEIIQNLEFIRLFENENKNILKNIKNYKNELVEINLEINSKYPESYYDRIDSEILKVLGNMIKFCRVSMNYSIEDLINKAMLKNIDIIKIENGEVKPKIKDLKKIFKVLNIK